MANIFSNWTGGGLASLTTSWIWWVVPTTIDTVVISLWDVIELDWAISWNSMNCSWILKASRVMNSSITLFTSSLATKTVTPTWKIDFWTSLDKIPDLYKAEFIMDSTTAWWIKYYIDDWWEVTTYSQTTRERGSKLTTDTLTWWTIINCANTTGWKVWDEISFEHSTQWNLNNNFTTIISAIAWTQVTLTNQTPYDLLIGYTICNSWWNIIFRSNDLTERINSKNPTLYFNLDTSLSDNKINFNDVVFRGIWATAWYKWWLMFVWAYSFNSLLDKTKSSTVNWCAFVNLSWPNVVSIRANVDVNNCCAFTTNPLGWSQWNQNFFIVTNLWSIVANKVSTINLWGFLQWNGDWDNVTASNSRYWLSLAWKTTFINSFFRNITYILLFVKSDKCLLNNTDIYNYGYWCQATDFWKAEWRDCVMTEPTWLYMLWSSYINWELNIANKNNNTLLQTYYSTKWDFIRDNVIFKNGNSSLKISPKAYFFKEWDIVSINNQPTQVAWYIMIDSLYSWRLPSLTLSWLWVTSVVWTAPAWYTPNTWIQFTMSVTQTSWADWTLWMKLEIDGTTWSVWVDNISAPAPVAVDTGALWVWSWWNPSRLITANFVSATDIWNAQVADNQAAWSMWELLSDWFYFNNVWADEHIWWPQTVSLNTVPWRTVILSIYREDTPWTTIATWTMTENISWVYSYVIDWAWLWVTNWYHLIVATSWVQSTSDIIDVHEKSAEQKVWEYTKSNPLPWTMWESVWKALTTWNFIALK